MAGWCCGPIPSDGHRLDESLGQRLVTVQVDGGVVELEGVERAGGVRGVLGDGGWGEGEGSEALVCPVLRTTVRSEGRTSSSHLVDRPRPRHDQAGGPVGLQISQSNITLSSPLSSLTVWDSSCVVEAVRNLLPFSPTQWIVLA